MIDVFAFVGMVVAVSALSLCHHTQPMPGMAWLRPRAQPQPQPQPFEDVPAVPEPPQSRAVPSRARADTEQEEAA